MALLSFFAICLMMVRAAAAYECAAHPGTQDLGNDFKPVLLQDWSGGGIRYVPRPDPSHKFEIGSVEDGSDNHGGSLVLQGLDILLLNRGDAITTQFHRPCQAYMIVHSPKSKNDEVDPNKEILSPAAGWTPVGWFEGSAEHIIYGIDETRVNLPTNGYVFRYDGADLTSIDFPSRAVLFNTTNLRNYKRRGFYIALFAEESGSPSPIPQQPESVIDAIPPAGRCPSALHDLWAYPLSTTNTPLDPTMPKGKVFESWHPVFDPCYWCLYDHEHGSDAGKLMGDHDLFSPRYTYAVFKNGNQVEPIQGFKSFVFRYDENYMIGYDIHVQASASRRLTTAFHTAIYTVAKVPESGGPSELMLRLTQKVNFGPLFVLDGNGKQVSIDSEDEISKFNNEFGEKMKRRRVVNGPGTNSYEKWLGAFMCMDDVARNRMLAIKITNTPTAIANITVPVEDRTIEPRMKKDAGFRYQQKGIERVFVVRNYAVGEEFCISGLNNFTHVQKLPGYDGNFYTDPKGLTAYADPHPNRIHQFVAPGFRHKIMGKRKLKMVNHFDTLYDASGRSISKNSLIWDAIDGSVN